MFSYYFYNFSILFSSSWAYIFLSSVTAFVFYLEMVVEVLAEPLIFSRSNFLFDNNKEAASFRCDILLSSKFVSLLDLKI